MASYRKLRMVRLFFYLMMFLIIKNTFPPGLPDVSPKLLERMPAPKTTDPVLALLNSFGIFLSFIRFASF